MSFKKNELKTRRLAWETMKKAKSHDRRLNDVMAEILKHANVNEYDRRFITEIVQGTVRMQGRLDWELSKVFNGDMNDLRDDFKILLRMGVYQIRYLNSVPDYAAVSTTVHIAKKIHDNLGGLTNALLRTLLNLKELDEPDEHTPLPTIASYLSHPEWLMSKWINEWGYIDAEAYATWNNKRPKLWFRVNKGQYTEDEFKAFLDENEFGYEQHEVLPEFFKTKKRFKVLNSDLFKEGKLSVQDPAGGLVVKLLDPQKDETIIDACSAPGGKTSYISELMENTGKIYAYDLSIERIGRLKTGLERLKATNVEISKKDTTKIDLPKVSKILLDVPCSGTGVMAKRSDLRWRRTMDNILEMYLIQRKLLWHASTFLEPGGVLVYSTCSVEPEENWMVIDAFLNSHPNFKVEDASNFVPSEFVNENGALETFPPRHTIDGGFAVRLRKDD